MDTDTSTVLPERTCLLHIGPFKTGTTTLQAAFHQNRESLARQGVHYAGKTEHPMVAAMAAAKGRHLPTASPKALERWTELVAEVHETGAARSVISSEFLCEAEDDRIRAILDDLGPERTHVVITVRPLVKILASQWQQYLQNQKVHSYSEWLDAILNTPDQTAVTPSFWRRHRHDRLVRRWADIAGVENLTVVAVDERDKGMLLRSFEDLLALEEGTLTPRELSANRSLTYAEAELLRAFNIRFDALGWSSADYTHFVRFGAARHLQQRPVGPEEERVLTPQWAADRAVAIASEMADNIAQVGVRVVGDLGSLREPIGESSIGVNAEPAGVPLAIASRFSAGLATRIGDLPPGPAAPSRVLGPLEAEGRRRRRELRRAGDERRREAALTHPGSSAAPVSVADVRVGELLATVFSRAVRRARRPAHRPRRP